MKRARCVWVDVARAPPIKKHHACVGIFYSDKLKRTIGLYRPSRANVAQAGSSNNSVTVTVCQAHGDG